MDLLLFEPTEDVKKHAPLTDLDIRIEDFQPKFFKLYSPYESIRTFRISLFRTYIYVLTRGKVKIYFAIDENDKILHSAYIIPSNWKYAFLGKHGANIGPCNTIEEARGKGLYPYMVKHIVKDNPDLKCYLMIKDTNISSIKGAQKAGFALTTRKVKQTKLLHRFVDEK